MLPAIAVPIFPRHARIVFRCFRNDLLLFFSLVFPCTLFVGLVLVKARYGFGLFGFEANKLVGREQILFWYLFLSWCLPDGEYGLSALFLV